MQKKNDLGLDRKYMYIEYTLQTKPHCGNKIMTIKKKNKKAEKAKKSEKPRTDLYFSIFFGLRWLVLGLFFSAFSHFILSSFFFVIFFLSLLFFGFYLYCHLIYIVFDVVFLITLCLYKRIIVAHLDFFHLLVTDTHKRENKSD